jgi:hypothetical protein
VVNLEKYENRMKRDFDYFWKLKIQGIYGINLSYLDEDG